MKVVLKSLPNNGYAFGINEGTKYFLKKGFDKFCAINNDIFFDRNFSLQAHLGFEKADIFGGKIYYAPGYEYHKNYQKKILGKSSGTPEVLMTGRMSIQHIAELMKLITNNMKNLKKLILLPAVCFFQQKSN